MVQFSSINRNIHYWMEEYNFHSLCSSFQYQYNDKMNGRIYLDKINIVIYDRNDVDTVLPKLYEPVLLTGWLPKKEGRNNNEYWDHDFAIAIDKLYPFNVMKRQLEEIKDRAFMIQAKYKINEDLHITTIVEEVW